MNSRFAILSATTMLTMMVAAQAKEDLVILENNVSFAPGKLQQVYEDDSVRIYRNPGAIDARPLYTVRVPNKAILNEILDKSHVQLEGAVSDTVVLRIPDESVDLVSSLVHEKGGGFGCGALIRVRESAPTEAPHVAKFRNGDQPFPAPPASDLRDGNQPFPSPTKYETQIRAALPKVEKQNLSDTVTKLGSFFTRHHRSAEAKNSNKFIKTTMESFGPITVKEFAHQNTPQPSLIATIPGQTDEAVVIGAHIDSIQGSGGDPDSRRAPGQDDDGSGTASLLETLRILVQSGLKFKYTIHVMGYAAEEVGLVGSEEIAEDFARRGAKVRAMFQLDMAGYLKAGDPMKLFFVSNGTTPELTDYTGSLIDTYLGLPYEKKPLRFGTSDHRSWFSRGYPVVFPTENPDSFNFNLHTVQDTIDKLNFDVMEKYVKLALAFAISVAEPIN